MIVGRLPTIALDDLKVEQGRVSIVGATHLDLSLAALQLHDLEVKLKHVLVTRDPEVFLCEIEALMDLASLL